jgi:putative ABC transport system substrate-binding protein
MSASRFLAGLTAGAMAVSLAVAGCSSNDPAPGEASSTGSDSYTVGIGVFLDHPSLQLIRDGFVDVLAEADVDVTYVDQNAQGDIANAATIASAFQNNDKIDLILAITTPIAQAVVQVEETRPVLYAGVTDPVDAGLMPIIDGPSGSNVTGTSDLNPNSRPIGLIQEIVPNAATVGVLYSSSEPNSLVQVEAYKQEAAPLGITIKESAITNSSELATGIQALAGVDAIIIPTDNTVVAGIATVIGFGEQNQIPIFTADAESVELGTVATRGLSYYELGRRTGEMALDILVDGTDVGTIPGLVVTDTKLIVNPTAAEKMGVTLSPSLLADAETVGS